MEQTITTSPITNCGGLIAQIAAYTLSQAHRPNAVLAYAGAVAAVAHLAGRRFRDLSNTRPNIYICAHGWSGVGKDAPRKTNREIIKACDMLNTLGDDFRSGEAIQDSLLTYGKILCQYDEIDTLFTSLKHARDTVVLNIMGEMLKQWGNSGQFAKRRLLANSRKGAKDDKTGAIVNHPHFTLFATGITSEIYKAISAKLAMNGFFARLLMFDAGIRGNLATPIYNPLPSEVVEKCRLICGADENPRHDIAPADKWTGIVVPTTSNAHEVEKQIAAKFDSLYDYNEDGPKNALWGRAMEKTDKLALILAISDAPEAPVITAQHLQLASEIVNHSTQEQLTLLGRYAADTDYEDLQKRFLDVLRKGRTPHRWFLRNKLRIPSNNLRELAETLRDAGSIVFCTDKGEELPEWRKGCCYELA